MYFDYSDLRDSKLYTVVKPVLKVLSHIVYSSTCVGRENVPAEGRLIIACNHIGTPDPAFIIANCPRTVHYMAKSDLFEKKLLSMLFSAMNAFPVVRCSADRKALRYALDVLGKEWALGIFPEGTRVINGKVSTPMSGATMIAHKTKAPIFYFRINKLMYIIPKKSKSVNNFILVYV